MRLSRLARHAAIVDPPASMDFPEGTKIHQGSGLVLLWQGRILLLHRAQGEYQGAWDIPGGGTQQGRGIEAQAWSNALREATEELGSLPPGIRGPTAKRYIVNTDTHTVNNQQLQTEVNEFVAFVVELPVNIYGWKPQMSPEHDTWKWVDRSDVQKLKLHPAAASVLESDWFEAGVPIEHPISHPQLKQIFQLNMQRLEDLSGGPKVEQSTPYNPNQR